MMTSLEKLGNPLITVAICTYNRAELLDMTLQTLGGMSVPSGLDWELLVVDNNSDDDTETVVRDHEAPLPIRYLREKRQGLSIARNRAVEEAAGEYIVWTDDDVQVGRRWIAAYMDAFRRWPEATFFGGPILPLFDGEPPGWLDQAFDSVRGAYAVKDVASRPVVLDEPGDFPYGANMAFKVAALRSRKFDVRLGRAGRDLISGEETQLMMELLEAGEHGRWVPDARVEHLIPRSRQTLRYLWRYFRGLGRTSRMRSSSEQVAQLFGRPRWAWRALVERHVQYAYARLAGSPEEWVSHLRAAAHVQGVLLGPPKESKQA